MLPLTNSPTRQAMRMRTIPPFGEIVIDRPASSQRSWHTPPAGPAPGLEEGVHSRPAASLTSARHTEPVRTVIEPGSTSPTPTGTFLVWMPPPRRQAAGSVFSRYRS